MVELTQLRQRNWVNNNNNNETIYLKCHVSSNSLNNKCLTIEIKIVLYEGK